MPRLSCWFIRAALIHLLIGFTLGSLLLWNKGVPLHPLIWRLLPAHMEFLLIGWTVQLAFGVAFWILPRFGTARTQAWLAWLAFGFINLGGWLVGVGAVWGASPWLTVSGRVLEAAAVVAFVLHIWPRIKPIAV